MHFGAFLRLFHTLNLMHHVLILEVWGAYASLLEEPVSHFKCASVPGGLHSELHSK